MTADELVAILVARGCQPQKQHDVHELRDAVHETVHVLQCGSRTYDREKLHEKLCKKARSEAGSGRMFDALMVRYELYARAVEMLACQHFGIEYDIDHWVGIMWLETAKSMHINIGAEDDAREAIIIASKQIMARRMLHQILSLKPPRRKRKVENESSTT